MEERLHDIEMIYIQNYQDNHYSIECISRFKKSTKLNFTNVEGVEIDARNPLEIKNSYIQMSEKQTKIWNIRLSYPIHLKIKYMGKIVIEVR